MIIFYHSLDESLSFIVANNYHSSSIGKLNFILIELTIGYRDVEPGAQGAPAPKFFPSMKKYPISSTEQVA